MKVIFLDVDGVLNSDEYLDSTKKADVQGIQRHIDVSKIRLLKKAIDETGAKVVLTSSWRLTNDLGSLRELFANYSIYLDKTPFIDNQRGVEIRKWLATKQNVDDFVILDDEVFESYDEELLKKLIQISDKNGTSLGEGLSPEDIDEIIKRLGRIKAKENEFEER